MLVAYSPGSARHAYANQLLWTETLTELESELGSLSGIAKDEQPEAGRSLRQAIRAGREHRLQDRIGRTRQMLMQDARQPALDNESEIHKGISEIREHIEAALGSVGEPRGRELERSLEELRNLAREMRFLRERGASTGTGRSAGATGPGGADGESIARGPFDDIAERTRELGGGLLEQGVEAGEIDPVLEQIEALTRAAGESGMPGSTAEYDAALRALMELEYALRGRVEDSGTPELLISEPSGVAERKPPEELRYVEPDHGFRRINQRLPEILEVGADFADQPNMAPVRLQAVAQHRPQSLERLAQ